MSNVTATKVSDLRSVLSDQKVLRFLVKFLFMWGDSIRPIVQKPLIDEFIGLDLIHHALDAGCGRGLYTQTLLNRAERVSAFDYSEVCVDAMRRRYGSLDKLSLCVASADNMPFADDQFDLVTHCEVLEHVLDDKKVISELYRVLMPGGKLVLSVPVPPAPIDDKEHVREGYTLDEITLLLEGAGFQIIRHQYCLFKISKSLISFQAWWGTKTKFPLPSLLLLPLYWERTIPQKLGPNNLPYDVIIEALKPSEI